MDIIEQQTHHLPPPEDTASTVVSNGSGKQNGTPVNGTK